MMDGLSVADALALQKNGGSDSFFGGNGAMFLFFLLAWGNGGLGGNNQALTQAELQRGFDTNTMINKLDGISNGLCDGFYAQNTTMLQGFNAQNVASLQGFNSVGAAIADLGYKQQQCCCETNRNIDAVRYENAKNTCDIINANALGVQRIVDVINNNTVQDLRDRLQDEKLANSQCQQNAYLVNALSCCGLR